MKNIGKLTLIGILLFCMGSVYAQPTIYDANRWMGSDLNGTARFIGMGGAMGALGGDFPLRIPLHERCDAGGEGGGAGNSGTVV